MNEFHGWKDYFVLMFANTRLNAIGDRREAVLITP
jgi:uncharacterized protein YdeI (YjbR/CyaY-like superfamily)